MRQPIEHVAVDVIRLPTVTPFETDGTARWTSTTMVLVELTAAQVTGLGYSYVDGCAAALVRDALVPHLRGADAFAIPQVHAALVRELRNQGRPGVAACAIAAVDNAMWDLVARLVGVPLVEVLGGARDEVPCYASGGFTSTELPELAREVEGYVAAGHRRIKIKIGVSLRADVERARVVRDTAGPGVELMVDANGRYTYKEALALADQLAALGVDYFEEPVSSDDLDGLAALRARAAVQIAAGEYGYDALYFRRMLEARAVDILQADATRCLGITGFRDADALCEAFGVPLSAHCAPAQHAHVAASARRLIHIEMFFDHVRLEHMVFDGIPELRAGALVLDRSRPGNGLELRRDMVARLAA